MKKTNYSAPMLLTVLLVVMAIASAVYATPDDSRKAGGIVFEDVNNSGRFDEGDLPLQGMRVSNGRDIVLTDKQGHYTLSIGPEADIFVTKPRGYRTPVDQHHLPQFFYMHRPNGSPSMEYPAFTATGPLPESVDFALYRQDEPDAFNVLIFGDPQTRSFEEIDYMLQDIVGDVVEEGYNKKAVFGITLGDVVHNDLSLYGRHNEAISRIDLPWYNVPGNHDRNYDAPELSGQYETFKATFGPAYYSFDYGSAHFIVLNDIVGIGEAKKEYKAGLGADQLEYLKNDLAYVPADKLIVLTMHIPFLKSTRWTKDRAALFELFKDRANVVSYSAHTHTHAVCRLGADEGWQGEQPLHHIIHITACGPWWRGLKDEFGLPAAVASDGVPNGYGLLAINGADYVHRYKAARRSDSFQMTIHAPQEILPEALDTTTVYANVFNAWDTAEVTMQIDGDSKRYPMMRSVEKDPMYVAYKAVCVAASEPGPDPSECLHLWKCPLPAGLAAGNHTIRIQAKNPDGQVFQGVRVIRVANEAAVVSSH